MQKSIFFTIALLASQPSHTFNFGTLVYGAKELYKPICDITIFCNIILLGNKIWEMEDKLVNGVIIHDRFERPKPIHPLNCRETGSILIAGGIRFGIHIAEKYYEQFQEWRKKRAASTPNTINEKSSSSK